MSRACRVAFYDSPIGRILLAESDEALVAIRFEVSSTEESEGDLAPDGYEVQIGKSPLLERAKKELTEYFSGKRKVFSVPCRPRGTPFQRAVWEAVADIPYGETRTYLEISTSAGSPRGCRATGQAVGANRLPILIPCHRVVASGGTLGGFGAGLDIKKYLLDLEHRNSG